MSVTPSPIGGFAAQFFDNNGVILSGGKIYTYAAGTTTPQACYTSAAGVTPHSNPIILDSAGRVPGGEIWLTDGLVYKFVIETSTAILIGTYDNITGVNSNFVNYTIQEEVITATAGQTVFNLSTINYTPGTNSLSVYIDGVNQYVGDSYLETDSDTVTFTAGLHVGAEVKFTTAIQTTTGAVNADIVAYDPPFTGGVPTTVEDKLAQYVSVKDFGAVGDGVADDTAAIQAALDSGVVGVIEMTNSVISSALVPHTGQILQGGILTAETGSWIDAFYIHNVDNVILRGIEMTGDFDKGMRISNANNITVQDCNIHDIGNTSPEYGFGILVGDYSATSEFCTNLKIINNTIKNIGGNGDFRGDAITLGYCAQVLVEGNYIDTTNRMGVAVISNAHSIAIVNNQIVSVALAGVDCEPDSPLPTCYGILISGNVIENYSRAGFVGVGSQFFAVDVHSLAYSVVVSDNVIIPGANATQIFHAQNGAYDIQFVNNVVLNGGTVDLFLKTYAGNGANLIVVANNTAIFGNVESFIDAFATDDLVVEGNIFRGSGAAGSYFLKLVDVKRLTVTGNTSNLVENFAVSGAGDCSALAFSNNISTTTGRGFDLQAVGTGIENLTISGNVLETPSSDEGVYVQLSSGYVRNVNLLNNVIPSATTKMFLTTAATGLSVSTFNVRADVAVPVAGQVIFELSTNKQLQYLGGAWVAPS